MANEKQSEKKELDDSELNKVSGGVRHPRESYDTCDLCRRMCNVFDLAMIQINGARKKVCPFCADKYKKG